MTRVGKGPEKASGGFGEVDVSDFVESGMDDLTEEIARTLAECSGPAVEVGDQVQVQGQADGPVVESRRKRWSLGRIFRK